jgi:hypothetical protein
MPTKEQLENRVRELEEENNRLQDQLDQIFHIVAPPEEKGEHEKPRNSLVCKASTPLVLFRNPMRQRDSQ